MTRCAALLLASTLLATGAYAQVTRMFPPHALRGELVASAPPDVTLDGRAARLAPGARVRNEENRFEVMGTLAGRRLLVHYTTDAGGQMLDIWILTASERARFWPSTASQAAALRFDPVAQTWSRP